jgi:signal transduction histidine kinase
MEDLDMPSLVAPRNDEYADPLLRNWTDVQPYRYRQLVLYGAGTIVGVLLVVGILTSLWLWQVKDWGLRTDELGNILAVEAGSHAAAQGIRAGDVISFADLQRLRRLSGEVGAGATVAVPVARSGQWRAVTLEAQPSDTPRRIELSVITWVGIGFVLLGIAPLIARRRNLPLWLLFICNELTGLFLIAEGPRPLHLVWAEVAAYGTLPLFPAVLLHFHTLFPRPQLGPRRGLVVRVVYACAVVMTVCNLIAMTDPVFDFNPVWTLILRSYLVGTLLTSLVLLVNSYRTQDAVVRTQLRIIAVSVGSGILINVLLLGLATILSTELRRSLENLGVLAALTTPFGYAFAMLKYNVLIDGLLWRRWLVRAASTVFVFGAGMLAIIGTLAQVGFTRESPILLGAIVVTGAVIMGAVNVVAEDWVEERLFKGASYVDLLDYATWELERLHKLDDYGSFFTEALPVRLKSTGALLFLAAGRGAPLDLIAASASWRDRLAGVPGAPLSMDGELYPLLLKTRGPVELTKLLIPGASPIITVDRPLVERLHALGAALLLPLVSNRPAYLIGLVALGAKETDEWYTRQELAALSALTRTAATAAQNVLLFETQQQQLIALQGEREYSRTVTRRAQTAAEQEREKLSHYLHDYSLQDLAKVIRALTRVREVVQSLLTDYEERRPIWEASAEPQKTLGYADMAALLIQWKQQLALLLGEDTDPVPPLSALPPDESLGRPLLIEGRPTIEALITQMRDIVSQVRSLCTAWHPPDLDDPFEKILLRSVTAFCHQYPQVQVAFLTLGQDEPPLPHEVKISGRSIVEQAIHNALQHAEPAHVTVHLLYDSDGSVVVTITDDGRGFTPLLPREYRTAEHHGLPDMYERAALVVGDLSIESAPGQGTRVTLRIPAPAVPPET